MKKIVFDGLTVRGAALKCLRLLLTALANAERKSQSKPQRKTPCCAERKKKAPFVEHQPERTQLVVEQAIVPASLLTPSPPDTSPPVRVGFHDGLALLAGAKPGDLVLLATIPPGTVLTTALLEKLDLKVVHKDQVADLIGWGFVRVEPK